MSQVTVSRVPCCSTRSDRLSAEADFVVLGRPDRLAPIWLRCGTLRIIGLLSALEPRWPNVLRTLNEGGRSIAVR